MHTGLQQTTRHNHDCSQCSWSPQATGAHLERLSVELKLLMALCEVTVQAGKGGRVLGSILLSRDGLFDELDSRGVLSSGDQYSKVICHGPDSKFSKINLFAYTACLGSEEDIITGANIWPISQLHPVRPT